MASAIETYSIVSINNIYLFSHYPRYKSERPEGKGYVLAYNEWLKQHKVDDLDNDGHIGINVIQKKTGLPIWIPFTDDSAVTKWERRPTFIALKQDGMPWTREQLSDAWLNERDRNPALAPLKEAGLVLHGLRATAVVRLRRAGASVLQISDMVGMSAQNGQPLLSIRETAGQRHCCRPFPQQSETRTAETVVHRKCLVNH